MALFGIAKGGYGFAQCGGIAADSDSDKVKRMKQVKELETD